MNRWLLFLFVVSAQGCATTPPRLCQPLAARHAGSCGMTKEWRNLFEQAKENAACDVRPKLCCRIANHWCCDEGDYVSCRL